MATGPSTVPIQVVNVDLAVERQKILREKLRDLFKAINAKSKVRKDLVYTVNAENTELETVLRANPAADALFTSFNYDAVASESFKEEVIADRPLEAMEIDPQLRYPVIAEYQKLIARGLFRHRRLVLVGDIYDKIKRVLKSRVPVEVSYFTKDARNEVSQFVPIKKIESISQDTNGSAVTAAKIPVGAISAIRIAGVEFGGIVNMPEVQNRFELKDQSIVDTAKKLYSSEGLKQVLAREFLLEEKLTFVRGKRVMIVLEPDLDHVIAERLTFDKMERLFRYHSVDEAEHALATGKSEGIVDYFETNGYDVVFDQLTQDERDAFLIAVLGDRLGEYLDKEIQSQRPNLGLLEETELNKIWYNLPEAVVDQTLESLKGKSYEKYLALVPVKIRENVILDFLGKPEYAPAAWAGVSEDEKKEILNAQAPLILAHINVTNRKLFITKFPTLKFEFADKLDRADPSTLKKEDRDAAFSLFRRSLERLQIPPGAIQRSLTPEQLQKAVSGYITSQPAEFYNRCNPLVRKQLWITVGKEYRDRIDGTLHYLDKLEIAKGNKDAALDSIFSNPEFLRFLHKGDKPELPQSVFLALKRTNKVESKNALLKKLLTSPDWKPMRIKGVPALLGSKEHYPIYQKLSDVVEGLDFSFEALVCTKAGYERLKDREPLKGATVTLIEDLVDSSLPDLFRKGYVSKEDYNQFSKSVEEQIAALRKKMAERESEDPVGVYVLESMQVLNTLTNQAMSGKVDKGKVDELDQRRQARQRLMDGLRSHIEKIEEFLVKGAQQAEEIGGKIVQAEKMLGMQSAALEESMQKARLAVEELQKTQQVLLRAESDKRKVALTQKELSLQFFDLIQPLVLEKIKKWPAPIESLLRLFRTKVSVPESLSKRVIFKFTDEEIERILRHKIVFCTKDEVLMQFVVTCLNIDHLEDSLFTLATRETLPPEIDVLFYGPGYTAEDFGDVLKERRMVAFADESFLKRLQSNEQLKSRTKTVLAKATQEVAQRRTAVEALGRDVREKQSKLRQIENSRNMLTEEKEKLEQRLQNQRERGHRYRGELEILDTKFQQVDRQFDEVKAKLDAVVGGKGGEAVSLIQGGQNKLGEQLGADLVKLNEELARMMYIKGVKDAGQLVSRKTQEGILSRIESGERFDAAKRKIKKMIVADDGSVVARNIKRNFIRVASQYFKVSETSMEDLSIKRVEGRAESANSEDYPFIALMSDHPDDAYGELRRIVRKVRNRLPATYQLVFTPMGEVWKLDAGGEEFRNIRSIQEHAALVNASIVDYTQPQTVLRLLQEKAPLS